MAQDIRLEFISQGFQDILFSDGCHELVQETAQTIADRANANAGLDSFAASSVRAGTRWIGFAKATDDAGNKAEAEDKALTRAL